MSSNLIMVDSAAKDSRSIPAMLHGKGDGRERLWLTYENSHPEIFDKAYLQEAFQYQARRGLIKTTTTSKKLKLNKLLLILLGIIFVIF